jgi:hypothetical protein
MDNWNKFDSIIMEPIEDSEDTIYLENKHYYKIESLFEYIKTKAKDYVLDNRLKTVNLVEILDKIIITNPLNPSYEIPLNIKQELLEKIKIKYPETDMNITVEDNLLYLDYHEHVFFFSNIIKNNKEISFYHFIIYNNSDEIIHDLGYIPSCIDIEESGETDITSSVLFTKIFDLWYSNKLIENIFYFNINKWITTEEQLPISINGKNRFLNLKLFKEVCNKLFK